jgi:hypothetical protein
MREKNVWSNFTTEIQTACGKLCTFSNAFFIALLKFIDDLLQNLYFILKKVIFTKALLYHHKGEKFRTLAKIYF